LQKLFYKFVNGDSTQDKEQKTTADNIFTCTSLLETNEGTIFEMNGQKFTVNLPGKFNAENAMLAVATANTLGVDLPKAAVALSTFNGIRGRMQEIPNEKGIKILIDYAPEPEEMRQALATAEKMPHQSLIHVFGSTGGHRDVAKRFEFGKLSAALADSIIITNDDVYDSDPEEIAENSRSAIEQTELKQNKVYTILDRKEAIKKAIEIAKAGDIILITGKGSEQFLVLPNNKRISWDEAKIIQELL
jgi:UDP-N-acetylmuramoyl-L-alanyl-D-glutamate--2,6-diaminopimelate ligase